MVLSTMRSILLFVHYHVVAEYPGVRYLEFTLLHVSHHSRAVLATAASYNLKEQSCTYCHMTVHLHLLSHDCSSALTVT